jgi:hypothetical protein
MSEYELVRWRLAGAASLLSYSKLRLDHHERQSVNSPLREAYQRLGEQPHAVLIDVRTEAEWMFVGIPELPSGRPLFLSWQVYPGMAMNGGFVDHAA